MLASGFALTLDVFWRNTELAAFGKREVMASSSRERTTLMSA